MTLLGLRPAPLSRALRIEWLLTLVRWLAIVAVGAGLLISALPPVQTRRAWLVLLAAAVYNASLQLAIVRSGGLVESGIVPTAGDALLSLAMLVLTGGPTSPLSSVVFIVTVSVVVRYGVRAGLAVALAFISYDLLGYTLDGAPSGGAVLFRCGSLLFAAGLTGYLRYRGEQSQLELDGRLREAQQMNRAADALSSGLVVDDLLSRLAASAAELWPKACVFVFPVPILAESGGTVQQAMPNCAPACRESCRLAQGELHPLVEASRESEPGELLPRRLPSGRQALLVPVRGGDGDRLLATLAIVPAEPSEPLPSATPRVLDALAERAGLAMENALLYHRLASRGEALRAAYAELAENHRRLLAVDELKGGFLANVSHEFRTPLTSIRSFSELLSSYHDESVQREFLEIINAESERLTRMLDDVLDITKIESGTMDWREELVPMGPLLEDMARAYTPVMTKLGLGFRFEAEPGLPDIRGDRDRLQQVVRNLLDNAAKFTAAGEVRLAARTVGPELEVAVIDQGPGVSPEHHDTIFAKFYQVPGGRRPKGPGAGLGLSICREIVEHHGGRLWIESEPGAGSTFRLRLPVTAA